MCPTSPITAACLNEGRFVNSTQDAAVKDFSQGKEKLLPGTDA